MPTVGVTSFHIALTAATTVSSLIVARIVITTRLSYANRLIHWRYGIKALHHIFQILLLIPNYIKLLLDLCKHFNGS
ncbi:MAG: hypothetical protein QGH66_08490 [Dehalococcoidia bacterium]|nr:hypothetical protein [Dehalococcoidia bacterium]